MSYRTILPIESRVYLIYSIVEIIMFKVVFRYRHSFLSPIGILIISVFLITSACTESTPNLTENSAPTPAPSMPMVTDSETPDPSTPMVTDSETPDPSTPMVSEPPNVQKLKPVNPNQGSVDQDLIQDVSLFIHPQLVSQGQAFIVVVDSPDSTAVSVAFNGEFFSLNRESDRFFAILPIAIGTPVGLLPLTVAIADETNRIALSIDASVTVLDTEYEIETIELDSTLSRLLAPEIIAEDYALRNIIQRQKSPIRLWKNYFLPPTNTVISSTFGVKRSYNGETPTDYHSGMDHAGAIGTPIIAPATGIVAWTGETERRGLGIILDHGVGLFTNYWHLSSIDVTVGSSVRRGEKIGRMGTSGLSTGPHLHWEVVINGTPVDPLQWIREDEFPNPDGKFEMTQAIQNDLLYSPEQRLEQILMDENSAE